MTANTNPTTWTYGAEHEWADWPLARPLPPGYGRDVDDITIVNSTGVANDPKGILHGLGGEINTPPTDTIEGQLACVEELRELYPEATVNYRSNLHLHIRVPGLREDLAALKRVQAHIHEWMPRALPVIEPMELPLRHIPEEGYSLEELERGMRRRLRRMRVSHQTLLPAARLMHQLDAQTIEEFFLREPPVSRRTGRPLFPMQPRCCVSLRQLRETDTVEFRHWPGTMDLDHLSDAIYWCKGYMQHALDNAPLDELLPWAREMQDCGDLPHFQPYDHWLEERYRRTVHDGTIPRAQLPINIAQVLEEARLAGRGG